MKIYLIEKGELKEIDEPIFSAEDIYLIDDEKTIYLWFGSKCGVDNKSPSTIQALKLEQRREDEVKTLTISQGQEPQEFLNLFTSPIKIIEKEKLKEGIEEELKEEPIQVPEIKTSIASSAAPGIPGKEDESVLIIEKSEGRRKCPKCGEENKTMIHESVDKTTIILDYPRMYGKKYKCGRCGCVWKEKYS